MNRNIVKLIILLSLLVVGCSSKSSMNPNDYAETVAFVSENFNTENISQSSSAPDYLEKYDQEKIADEVTMYTNTKKQISYIQFKGLALEKADIILDDIGYPDDTEEIDQLLNNPDGFEKIHQKRYLTYKNNDEVRVHIVAFDNEVSKKMGQEGPFSINIFYNDNIYDDFIKD